MTYSAEPEQFRQTASEVTTPARVAADAARLVDTTAPRSADSTGEDKSIAYGSSSLKKFGGAALIALVTWFALGTGNGPIGDETSHAHWSNHVEPLNQIHRQTGTGLIKHVQADGTSELVRNVHLADDDRDLETSDAVKSALSARNPVAAEEALQAAQQIPEPLIDDRTEPLVKLPTVTAGWHDAILSGDANFYHLYLFDSCDEDGDVVDVYLEGEFFARVPITHAGATLSVPVAMGGPTLVEIVGFRDGEGGVTVACQSSQGDFFMRTLAVGERQPLALVK